ncbi:MAG: PfkB family carbohydrate kinase [Candidatus Magasanikbacteria bacterium]
MADIIIEKTHGVGESSVLAAPSVNLEISLEMRLSEEAKGHCMFGGKNTVKSINIIPGSPVNAGAYEIAMKDGYSFLIPQNGAKEFAAGSSVNVAFVLHQLGLRSIGLVGPIGSGRGASSLIPALRSIGLGMFLFLGHGTSLTLTVRDPDGGGSTLFCAKRDYDLTEEVAMEVSGWYPEVLVLTGVKPSDIGLAKAMISSNKTKKKAFIPHRDLMKDLELRSFLVEMSSCSNLTQINEAEAALLLGRPFEATANGIKEVAEILGSEKVVVTCGGNGAFFLKKGGEPIIVPAYPCKQIVDTCGVGDVFFSTLIYYMWFYHEDDVVLSSRLCLRMASWVSSCKLAKIGPWDGIPSVSDCQDKIAEFRKELGE